MLQQSPYAIALDLLREWDAGKTPTLQEYASRFPEATPDALDLLADYLILDALVGPAAPRAASANG